MERLYAESSNGRLGHSTHHREDVANVVLGALNQSQSFLAFVQSLHAAGIEFAFSRKDPVVRIACVSHRLSTLGLVPELRDAFARWEGRSPLFSAHNAEAKAFAGRVAWITLSAFTSDIPAQQRSLEVFAMFLTVEEISEAMALAWRAPKVSDDEGRFKYACAMLHPLRRQRKADHDASKATVSVAWRGELPPLVNPPASS